MGAELKDIPLDVPIPLAHAVCRWSEEDGVWLSWDAWVDGIFRRNAERRSKQSQQSLFEEKRSYASQT